MNRSRIFTSLMVAGALYVVAQDQAHAGTKVAQNTGSATWCHAAVTAPVASGPVKGVVAGEPFVCESVLWNSITVTFKQNHKRYCKVVVNMMRAQKPLCNIDLNSDNNKRVQIYVYTRSSNTAKVQMKHFTSKDNFGIKFKLLSQLEDDSVPGSISLRLPDGGNIGGTFTALRAPRVIWDDEAVLP